MVSKEYDGTLPIEIACARLDWPIYSAISVHFILCTIVDRSSIFTFAFYLYLYILVITAFLNLVRSLSDLTFKFDFG